MNTKSDDSLSIWIFVPIAIVLAVVSPMLGMVADLITLMLDVCCCLWAALSALARWLMRMTFAMAEWVLAVRDSFPEGALRAERARTAHRPSSKDY